MYITTTGLGRRDPRAAFEPARPGDRILLSGPIAAHGTAIMLARGEFDLDSDDIVSDTRSLWPAVDAILGPGVRQLRDATRGGVASVLNELARDAGVAMLIQEAAVPVAPAVAGACELLGIDPMYVANEGVFVAIVAPGCVAPGFADIGEVKTEPPGMVLVADELRRQAGDGRAGRRPAAEDLLMHELSIADAIVRIATRPRGRAPDRDRRGQGRAPAPGRARRAGVRVHPRRRGHRGRGRRAAAGRGARRRHLPARAGSRANCPASRSPARPAGAWMWSWSAVRSCSWTH